MSIERRRATFERLLANEAAAGRPIHEDAEFLSLAERWISHEIDMTEMRQQYQVVRAERRRRKWASPSEEAPLPTEPAPSADEFLAEIARLTRSDHHD